MRVLCAGGVVVNMDAKVTSSLTEHCDQMY